MRMLERNTIATQITGVGIVQNLSLYDWAFFARLASKNLLLKSARLASKNLLLKSARLASKNLLLKSARLASSSLLLKGVFVFYLYLYLYLYGNDRW